MATNNKPTIYFRVVNGHNPANPDELIKRPQITRRETYSIGRVINAAIDSGRVRGKIHDLTGIINGFMDQTKVLLEEGKAVNAGFMRLHAELSGQVGPSEQLSSENGLTTCVTPLAELKLDIDGFNWQRIDDSGIKLVLSTIKGEDCKIGFVKGNATARINGRNCFMSEGDSVTVAFGEKILSCDILDSEEDKIDFRIPDLPREFLDKEVLFTVTSRCGIEDGPVQFKQLRAKVLENKFSLPRFTRVVSQASGAENTWRIFADTLNGEVENLTDDTTVSIELFDPATNSRVATLPLTDENSCEKTATGFTVKIVSNTSTEPDMVWQQRDYERRLCVTNALGSTYVVLAAS